jgi:cytochrome c5
MKASFKLFLPSLMVAAIFAATLFAILAPQAMPAAPTAGSPSGSSTNSVAPAAEKVVVRPQLTGAELYSVHCNRCHPERYPTERTAAQWKTIMLHMQVRANLPVSQAKLILKYLQDNSGR